MSTFNSLYTVRSGLDAARRALDVVGQNIANASTAGYSRQEVSFVAAEPGQVINSAGRGISDANVLRYRDEFLDRQYRNRAGSQGYFDTLSTHLAQVEEIVGTLADGNVRTALGAFFTSWDNLALRPSDPALRRQVVSATEEFLAQARATFDDLARTRSELDEAIRDKVGDINSATQQLEALNQAIVSEKNNPQKTNELLDQRDRLLDSLAKLAGTSNVLHNDGTVTVFLGSLPIVDPNGSFPIDAAAAMQTIGAVAPLTGFTQETTRLTWNGTTNSVTPTSGEIGALLSLRDKAVPEQMQYLDNLVRTLATQVNTLHMAADKNGNPLPAAMQVPIFTSSSGAATLGTGWMDIAVNPALKADPSLLVAGDTLLAPPAPPAAPTSPPAPSDGERALKIARLRDAKILTGAPVGTSQVTAGEYMRSVSSVLGLQLQQAVRKGDAAGLQVAQAEKYRQSVSGVSIDDEMTKMIQFQQAYNAAARVMTTLDEMLDIMINRTGVVGR